MSIPFDQFSQLDLRIGRILALEEVAGKDKLYQLTIDLAEEKPRTIVAGIKPWYTKEELLNRLVVVVANLEPRTIAGIESCGMLLCAEGESGSCVLLQPDKEVIVGAKVR
ncbi:MAG: Methionine-tRNA ligase [candidate division CPR1 bacterium GW2011_GWA2_42_17]|uniref:Methionine-tRNA ligase n=1 Tax=candidate division CPR1 bacterium GW2011_GWA2_42_17 TaxID=1618341 RepID=A0A0G1B6E2_9BACT|nr:MAG: Methionine-tRNA ligase [candidate division CPR1 bacterium GW2011_GWA2_42_17]